MEYFLAIADFKSFSRASLRISVAQPVLSRQIKALEQELGVALYHRTGHGVVLSEAGKRFEQYARGILDTAAAAKKELAALGSEPSGRVLIGMPPSVQAVLAAPLVEKFQNAFPHVSLGIMEGFSGHVQEWLMTGRLDIAILYHTRYNGMLASDPLLTDELFLLGPINDPARAGEGPIRASNLRSIPLILPNRPHGLRILIDEYLDKAGVTPNIQLEMDAMSSTLSLIEHGVGYYTILSYSSAHELITSRRIRYWKIVEPTITRSLVVASSTQRPSTKASRDLMIYVRQLVQQLVEQGRWSPPA
ncbi:LysR family transcriptional regulator [Pollutimonas bauzanensis]|uniref:LysR family transcriptional regulator, nitrogen assimilation regulatory protein n=1 Tax=Pollutimonas bauzanensis TaxID=658167 RepID=A0A1M5TI33_9BURK|nr:LysR substrate-binding domain-containing protein [Pollutimonas bauzanensis]SHH50366.1 LysR family transcriptional regulator, nitrogen assimilation regulatory protein [Pollutimonas bauzanensis]